jgi:hypothetical protein
LAVTSPGGLEGVADDDPYEVQWQVWRRPVPACLSVPELWYMGLYARGRPPVVNSGRDGIPPA